MTSAGTGIGEAIAHKFAREGARVVVCGLPDDPIANAPYGGTKGWMHSFMKGVAVEQAKYGVRANKLRVSRRDRYSVDP